MMQDVNLLSDADETLVHAWNRIVPKPVECCLHDLISERGLSRQNAPAVCAWDGDFTYNQLEDEATQLSQRLRHAGVEPNTKVPLCFEKSKWTVVAMLAVLKAGAAFVPLDPSQASNRRERMLARIGAKVVLVSEQHSNLDVGDGRRIVVVGSKSQHRRDENLRREHHEPKKHLRQDPGSAAYVLFTSGSTGQPKGVVVPHRAISSSCYHHGVRVGNGPETRMLQFASYTFDACCQEIFTTLVWGGVVIVPSDDQRLGRLGEVMNKMKVNTAVLTASVSRLIEPSQVPSLHTLMLAGEVPTRTDFTRWRHLSRVMNVFGPTETAVVCTVYDLNFSKPDACCIGTGVGSATWVADPRNHERLVPIGAIGELLIEGPILAQNYFDDPKRTAAAFVKNPTWLLEAGRHGVVYKTGDLVRYNPDGTLTYMGRKDTQVKIRGQRVEMGETEHHLRECLPQIREVAAEVIVPAGGAPMLAAFVASAEVQSNPQDDESAVVVYEISAKAADELSQRLPAYMIPTVYFRLNYLPTNASFKTDRKKLRDIGASFSARQLADLRSRAVRRGQRAPSNETERELQRLCAVVLEIKEVSNIGIDENFFRLGGDSISVMRLVGEAHKSGIALSIADVFRNPCIAGLASLPHIRQTNASIFTARPASFSLVEESIVGQIRDNLHKDIGIAGEDVEDMLPVTLFQQEVLDRAVRIPEQTFNYFFLNLKTKVNIDALQHSCQLLTRHLPILRTLFIPLDGVYWQIVLSQLDPGFEVVNIDGDINVASREQSTKSTQRGVRPGDPLTSFTLLRHDSGAHRLMIRLSHAQYDGICFSSIITSLVDAYQNRPLAPFVDFSVYLAHSRRQESQSIAYWRNVLHGSNPTSLGRTLQPESSPGVKPSKIEASRVIHTPQLPAGLTLASLLTSSWAAILVLLTGHQEVVFGRLVAGRNANIPGVQDIIGPCINTVPVRIAVPYPPSPSSTTTTVETYLREVQDQHVAMGEADSLGLTDIINHCTTWTPNSAVHLDSVVEHSSLDTRPTFDFDGGETVSRLHWFEPDAVPERLVVTSAPEGEGSLRVRVAGNSHVISQGMAEVVVERLVRVMEGIAGHSHKPLSEVLGSVPDFV
ncbi:nonribosomal peptide synthetase fmqA [Colletotrichum liriopes]|uniref:Nonribosomal peptide synthetase fmqA n=1 Tax=Colletotrichum liriopes TaxID=708192 RepID=A0AA37LVW7_9PEZI|nr:nonribosomal peptide synthetase fmqA [Colletotrichum liriopes]